LFLANWQGEKEDYAKRVYATKSGGYGPVLYPRSQPVRDEKPVTVSGLSSQQIVGKQRAQWLNADSIGLAMIFASLLLFVSGYLLSLA
jgi:hypothetical protein